MKIYLLNKEGEKSKEFIDVSYFSFLKAYISAWFGFLLIILLVAIILSFSIF